MRYKRKSLRKSPPHKVPVDLCLLDRNKSLHPEIIVMLHDMRWCKLFKFFKHNIKLLMVSQIEMCVHKVVHSLDIVTGFYIDHLGIIPEKIYPLLCIPVILNKILPDERIPAIALIQVQPFVKACLLKCISGKMFTEKLPYACFIFFIPCMSVFYVPAV